MEGLGELREFIFMSSIRWMTVAVLLSPPVFFPSHHSTRFFSTQAPFLSAVRVMGSALSSSSGSGQSAVVKIDLLRYRPKSGYFSVTIATSLLQFSKLCLVSVI